MKYINLNKGYRAIVDDEDYERLLTFEGVYRYKKNKTRRWFIIECDDGQLYAVGNCRAEKDRWTRERMHRVILHVKDPALRVDHINGNGLDNQKHNLRIATNQQNAWNMKKPVHRSGKLMSSLYKGVSWNRQVKKWQAHIRANGKSKYLGLFVHEQEAAKAYNDAASQKFGNFARINNVNKD